MAVYFSVENGNEKLSIEMSSGIKCLKLKIAIIS
jgi:hypothetical protein